MTFLKALGFAILIGFGMLLITAEIPIGLGSMLISFVVLMILLNKKEKDPDS